MSDSEQGGLTPEGDDWNPDTGSLLGGIAIGVVVVAVVWLLVAFVTGGHDSAKSPDAAEPGAALGDLQGFTSQPSSSTPLERCAVAADVVERPLKLARPALDQWTVHVGAMNKLMVGAITLPQATAFWNDTRVGAYARIGRFEDADAQLERRGVDCPAPRRLGSEAFPELRACAQHVAAELRALGSARTAITTWSHHMHAMDQLRDGKISATAATRMWLTMWQRGVDELKEFRSAARAAGHSGACGGTDGGPQPSESPTEPPAGSLTGPPTGSPTESQMSGMDMP